MGLVLKRIDCGFEGLDVIRGINVEAFPEDELVPVDVVMGFVDGDLGGVFAICDDDGDVVGFTSLMFGEELVYMLQLAIDSKCRGMGYGSEALGLIRDYTRDKDGLIFMVEALDEGALNYNQRVARVRFYERFGFELYGVEFELSSGLMALMGDGGLDLDVVFADLKYIFTLFLEYILKDEDLLLALNGGSLGQFEGLFKAYEAGELDLDNFEDVLSYL